MAEFFDTLPLFDEAILEANQLQTLQVFANIISAVRHLSDRNVEHMQYGELREDGAEFADLLPASQRIAVDVESVNSLKFR